MFLDYNPTQGSVIGGRAYHTGQPAPPLNQWVQSYWQLTVPKGRYHFHSIPDNCVDWIINLNCFDDNFLIPPFISSTIFDIDGPASFFGIRFRILGHQGLISEPLGEWCEASSRKAQSLLSADMVYSVYETIVSAQSFDERCHRLSAAILPFITLSDVDVRLSRYIQYCYSNVSSNLDLSDSRASEFGVSARQLRRLSKQYTGLAPKDFSKVLRFQNALKAMNEPQHSKTYLDLYYDQPHWIREFKRLSGATPSQFRKMSVLYNDPSSD